MLATTLCAPTLPQLLLPRSTVPGGRLLLPLPASRLWTRLVCALAAPPKLVPSAPLSWVSLPLMSPSPPLYVLLACPWLDTWMLALQAAPYALLSPPPLLLSLVAGTPLRRWALAGVRVSVHTEWGAAPSVAACRSATGVLSADRGDRKKLGVDGDGHSGQLVGGMGVPVVLYGESFSMRSSTSASGSGHAAVGGVDAGCFFGGLLPGRWCVR